MQRRFESRYGTVQYTVVGHSEASATGLLLFGVIPILTGYTTKASGDVVKLKNVQ